MVFRILGVVFLGFRVVYPRFRVLEITDAPIVKSSRVES